jgi:putative Ca2+/H+ antiporter (TMEM165/GDT1 family)
MEAFIISFGLVALAEIGDKTQFLALVLATRFHRPVPILAGILVAALANHLTAAGIGYFVGAKLDGWWLHWLIAASFFAIAVWVLLPEKAAEDTPRTPPRMGVFGATVCSFFIAELGDRTEIATAGLAAEFHLWLPVTLGTTLAMLAANLPVVLLGRQLSRWMSSPLLRWGAAVLSVALAVLALIDPR